MKFHKNKILTTVSAITLMLAVGACSSSSDDDGIAKARQHLRFGTIILTFFC